VANVAVAVGGYEETKKNPSVPCIFVFKPAMGLSVVERLSMTSAAKSSGPAKNLATVLVYL
jgi:hypothetical protein